jgi:hypothetical protein
VYGLEGSSGMGGVAASGSFASLRMTAKNKQPQRTTTAGTGNRKQQQRVE